ncbi:class I SAM-dependent methyltransferase [Flavobacterium sp.]|uniref:class I SAM-dependent methyltransferase n=1 Tax=Flavobacterium sp. TaxID=239 RepID=UPI0037502D40
MNRTITNSIRYIIDEFVPPILRDSKWFMYLFFFIFFKGKKIKLYMEFKQLVYLMNDQEYAEAYRQLDCMGTDRPTDLNQLSINYMLKNISSEATNLLDVGCGRGYWLNKLGEITNLNLTGFDMHDSVALTTATYVQGRIEKLPFAEKSFDIVTCHHLLEHLKDLPAAISELKRVAKKQLIIVVPCQRYYYYTLDMHINFFPIKEYLQEVMKIEKYTCENKWGDWVYIGYLD